MGIGSTTLMELRKTVSETEIGSKKYLIWIALLTRIKASVFYGIRWVGRKTKMRGGVCRFCRWGRWRVLWAGFPACRAKGIRKVTGECLSKWTAVILRVFNTVERRVHVWVHRGGSQTVFVWKSIWPRRCM